MKNSSVPSTPNSGSVTASVASTASASAASGKTASAGKTASGKTIPSFFNSPKQPPVSPQKDVGESNKKQRLFSPKSIPVPSFPPPPPSNNEPEIVDLCDSPTPASPVPPPSTKHSFARKSLPGSSVTGSSGSSSVRGKGKGIVAGSVQGPFGSVPDTPDASSIVATGGGSNNYSVIEKPGLSIRELAEVFLQQHGILSPWDDDCIRAFLGVQKHYPISHHLSLVSQYLSLGEKVPTNKVRTRTTRMEPRKPVKPGVSAGNRTKDQVGQTGQNQYMSVYTVARIPASNSPVPTTTTPGAKNLQKKTFPSSSDASSASSAKSLPILDIDGGASHASDLTTVATVPDMLSSNLASIAMKLVNRSDVFPELMSNEKGQPHFIENFVPARVLDQQYTRAVHACTLGTVINSGYADPTLNKLMDF